MKRQLFVRAIALTCVASVTIAAQQLTPAIQEIRPLQGTMVPEILNKLPSDKLQFVLPQLLHDLPPGELPNLLDQLRIPTTTTVDLGVPTKPGQFQDVPQATTFSQAGNIGRCTSVVLTAHNALTARHCFDGYESQSLVNRKVSLKGNGWAGQISGKVVHEHIPGDLAFLCLNPAAPPQAVKDAPELPTAEMTLQTEKVTIVGYGESTKPLAPGFGPYMGASVVTSVSELELLATIAGNAPNLACSGDSGGPAYLERNGKKILIGIARAYADAAECGKPVVYTRLDTSAMQQWLNQGRAACVP